MSNSVFQKQQWRPFTYGGETYVLSELDEFQFVVSDSQGNARRIVVTCSDHCFTRERAALDTPELIYPGSSRSPGIFDFDRYQCTQNLRAHLALASQGKVYLSREEMFVDIRDLDLHGQSADYAIFFSLDPVKGIEGIDLHLRVRTAFPIDRRTTMTFGQTRFKTLVELRMKGKYPKLNSDRRRRW